MPRAQEYALLAALLLSAPSAALLEQIAQLNADATPLGRAHATLAKAAAIVVATEIEREYFHLFIGLGRGELLPYASYYLTGFLNERPLSRLRDDLAALGIERVENNFEPEDHAATLCEIMAGLAAARFPASPEAQRAFFEKHVSRWMGRLFADMEKAENARFYRSVGTLGRVFLEIESEAFTFAN
jgi:TorA maturation chaperone TorD